VAVSEEETVVTGDDLVTEPTPPEAQPVTPEEQARIDALIEQIKDAEDQIIRLNDHLAGAPNNEQYRQELSGWTTRLQSLNAELGVG
jgi:TolA-binding protein